MNSEAGPGMLPEEILALIIQMAMDGPALERYREENVEFGWPFIVDNSDLRETFPQASKPKLPIALVSRTFWRIALKFLYDTIILTNVVSLKLVATFEPFKLSHRGLHKIRYHPPSSVYWGRSGSGGLLSCYHICHGSLHGASARRHENSQRSNAAARLGGLGSIWAAHCTSNTLLCDIPGYILLPWKLAVVRNGI